jgi:hypothetical protein
MVKRYLIKNTTGFNHIPLGWFAVTSVFPGHDGLVVHDATQLGDREE